MATILLTQGKVAIVDEEDIDRLSLHSWFAHRQRPGKWRAATMINGRTVFMPSVILGHEQNRNIVPDHINGNSLDNRKENLRIVSQSENTKNNARNRKATGVSKHYAGWQARVSLGPRRRKVLGTYATEAEAVDAVAQFKRKVTL